ncbi:MAG: BatA domain-containing protein, partial [Planctomycetaceae bacterium]|nr:BatA domain-containing protein [Planctomycetaceae bacterium]
MPLPIVWALGFANGTLLWGLGAASLPIIIHLLNKRKFRETRWAAMRF